MSIGKDAHDEDVFYYDNLTLKNSNEEEILGLTIYKKCRKHVKNWVPYWDSLHDLVLIKGKQYALPWSNIN